MIGLVAFVVVACAPAPADDDPARSIDDWPKTDPAGANWPRMWDPGLTPDDGPVTGAVAVALAYGPCMVDDVGTLRCWEQDGRETFPERVVAASGSGSGICALRPNGSLYCPWNESENDVPWVTVTGQYDGPCGLTMDGRIDCAGDSTDTHWEQPPAGEFTALSVGYGGCALDLEGKAACWGAWEPDLEEDIPDLAFSQIDVGQGCACALDEAGEAWCWGKLSEAPPAEERFLSVSADWDGVCGIRLDGTLACWGLRADTVTSGGTYLSVVNKDMSTCAINSEHAVECWGNAAYQFWSGQPP